MIKIEFINLYLCFDYVMPVSSKRITRTNTVGFGIKGIKGESLETHIENQQNNNFLTIAPALPILPGAPIPPKLFQRRYNSFSQTDSPFNIEHDKVDGSSTVTLQWTSEGKTIVATRTSTEKEKSPDRICLDRRGLTTFPNIVGEPRLRLLSLQHNLLTKIENCNFSPLTKLVFLDLYDNQIERICNFDILENLRVLLIGKNRIKKIEGLKQLSKLEVLDLHGNQIVQISDLNNLVSLKVLNLAGNNIKAIGYHDFQGLTSLKELNLRRNKIKKLLGFDETLQLQKLYLSNNDIHKIEDIESLAKVLQLKEITIDGNPVTLNGDYISFLVSYLPNLQFLSAMPITEQIRRAAVAWRTTKEQNNSTFLNLSAQVCMNARREEIISNAKINWELLRCHSKSSTNDSKSKSNIRNNNINAMQIQKSSKFSILKPKSLEKAKSKGFGSLTSINENIEATKMNIKKRSNSSDNLFKLKDTTKTYPLEFKLPPILDSIVDSLINNKFDEKVKKNLTKIKAKSDTESTSSSDSEILENHENLTSSLSSHLLKSNNYISPRDISKLVSNKTFDCINVFLPSEIVDDRDNNYYEVFKSSKRSINDKQDLTKVSQGIKFRDHGLSDCQSKSSTDSSGYCSLSSKTNSIDSCKSVLSDFSSSPITKNILQKYKNSEKDKNKVKSAQVKKIICYKSNRAATARAKYRAITSPSPPSLQNPVKEREQGGDYLIEIVGRCLNIYGQGALRFIDRSWDSSRAQEVNIVKFNYVQFNDVAKVLCKIKNRFPNIEHFMFKETNISYLGQLNALAEVQGLTSIHIETGNPIISKDWKVYAIFRLAHWGLKIINGKEITNEEINLANKEYAGLVDIVMCSLPESLLQPLLQRLHLEKVQRQTGDTTAKQFLLNSDPALRSVVAKEALQWRKGTITQEDLIWRHRGKIHLLNLINLAVDAIQKLQLLENKWPSILYEIIHTTLSDFSEMDTYMKRCSKTLENNK